MINKIEEGIQKKIGDSFDEINNLNTLALAKIMEVNNEGLFATIKKIAMTEFNGKFDDDEPVENVPIMPIFNSSNFFVNAPYNVGDLVVVGFFQHSLEGTLDQSEPVEPNSYDRYSENDAFILGNITAKYSDSHADGFSIIHKGTGNYIKIDSGGGIEIQGNVNITGDLSVSGNSQATDHISSGISGKDHKHGGVTSGSSDTEVPKS